MSRDERQRPRLVLRARPRAPRMGHEPDAQRRRRRSSGDSGSCSRPSRRPPARSSTRTGAGRRPQASPSRAASASAAADPLGRRRKLEYRLHRVSDWVTDDTHEIADLLHDCDILAIKAANGLESVPARGRDAVAPARRVAPARLHRARGRRPARPEARRRFAAAERAELRADRGVLLPRRREAREDALRRGNARTRPAPVRRPSIATAGVLALFGALDLESAPCASSTPRPPPAAWAPSSAR